MSLPCVIYEDEQLLVANKPPGLNTHAPSPYAGEGLYDWLRHREPRWASLAIIHRLDKDTSGVMVFGKTAMANRALTEQFTQRVVRKKYLLLTDRPVQPGERVVKSKLLRAGERYVSGPQGDAAETRFNLESSAGQSSGAGLHRLVEAVPLTGRTHQIRVHAAENGFPILGDTLYGGTPWARTCLHAAELTLRHPASGEELTFQAPLDFDAVPGELLRNALIDPDATNAYRLVHGASDGWPGWYADRLGEVVLSQSAGEISTEQRDYAVSVPGVRAVYHKVLDRQVRRASRVEAAPRLVSGPAVGESFTIRENGLNFALSITEGYSVGLFLDQRDNRRRLLTGHIAAGFRLRAADVPSSTAEFSVLNTFAYTCGFSVCAAAAGGRTTSLDLSRKYLAWGTRNLAVNGLDPAQHDCIYGDVFDWLRRFARRGRAFDVVVIDPPTFSQSKAQGVFRAEKDYGQLVAMALPLLRPGGVLLASTNAADWLPESFVASVEEPIHGARREILQRHYVPQPPDFPISRAEPAFLKSLWLRIG